MTFSATEAAFEGFRLVRRHPLALVFWGLAYIVFFAVMFAALGGTIASFYAAAKAMEGAGMSPDDLEVAGAPFVAMLVLLLPLSLLFTAILSAAIARAVVRPAERSFGYIRIGSDELRVLAVTVALAIVTAVVTAVLFSVVGVGSYFAGQVNAGLGALVGVLLGLAAAAALIWFLVRLSLAVPITVAERRIALFDSIALTKGKTLPLLGMAILALVMTLLINVLASVVAWPIELLTGGVDRLAQMDGSSTIEILQQAAPAVIAFIVVNAIGSALQLAVLYAPFSSAYLDLKGLPHEH